MWIAFICSESKYLFTEAKALGQTLTVINRVKRFLELSAGYVQVDGILKIIIMQIINDNVGNCRRDPTCT